MLLRRWILLLICVTFIAAPYQRASAHIPASSPVEMAHQTQAMDASTHSHKEMSRHYRQSGMQVVDDQDTPGCCPTDHSSPNGGYCSDCLASAILNTKTTDPFARLFDVATHRVSDQSVDFIGDAPVPKN